MTLCRYSIEFNLAACDFMWVRLLHICARARTNTHARTHARTHTHTQGERESEEHNPWHYLSSFKAGPAGLNNLSSLKGADYIMEKICLFDSGYLPNRNLPICPYPSDDPAFVWSASTYLSLKTSRARKVTPCFIFWNSSVGSRSLAAFEVDSEKSAIDKTARLSHCTIKSPAELCDDVGLYYFAGSGSGGGLWA